MGEQRYKYIRLETLHTEFCLTIDQFYESFLFGSSETRPTGSDSSTHASTYNTVAIQFAPKHLGLILVICMQEKAKDV